MNSKSFKIWLSAWLCGMFIAVVCLFLIISGFVSFSLQGFGVDSLGRLYIGEASAITRYDNGLREDIVHTNKHRFYAFSITEQDVLIVAGDGVVSYYDLNGDLLDQRPDLNNETYEGLKGITSFSATNGHTYEIKNFAGRYQIVCDNRDIVYQMPLFDYGVKLLFIAGICCTVMCVVVALWKSCVNEQK